VTAAPCRILDWDSAFFGCRIATVTAFTLTDDSCRTVLDWCEAHHVDCLYFLADPGDYDTARVAAVHGFSVTDIRLDFERAITAGPASTAADIREARASDIPALCEIAADAHRDTRFFFDRHFPADRAPELYRTWIARSCDGFADGVLVADCDGRPAGYVTMHLEADRCGRIGLFGVAPAARGQGRGARLIEGAVAWLAARDRSCVRVATQARNVPGVRAYERNGFQLARVGIWHHRWFGRPAAP
jgi:ribosomal-protein-alanine N-acetyltransferase